MAFYDRKPNTENKTEKTQNSVTSESNANPPQNNNSNTTQAPNQNPSSNQTNSSNNNSQNTPQQHAANTTQQAASQNTNVQQNTPEAHDSPEQKEADAKKEIASAHKEHAIFGETKLTQGDLSKGDVTNLLQDLTQGDDIKTAIDEIVQVLVKNEGKATVKVITQSVSLDKKKLDMYLRILKRGGIVSILYPTNPFASPVVTLHEGAMQTFNFKEEELPTEKKLLEQYTVIADFVVADVKIWVIPFENTPIYQVVPHKLSPGSVALLEDLREIMIAKIPVKLEDITDPRKVLELKETFFNTAKEELKKSMPELSEDMIKVLAGAYLHKSYGMGDMEIIMGDNWLEEVAINGANEPISVYHRKHGWIKTTTKFKSENDIYNFSSQVGRKVGKEINNLNPIMDAHLLTGDRVAATLFPISTGGDTMTIRRFSRNPWTIVHMVDPKNNTMSKEMMAFLWLAIQYELNIMVVGGTASGKTSVLNTLVSMVQPTNRVITIEDTREISLPEALHWNWVPLSSRSSNTEGLGEVTMLDLMVASLRMRPDRIIVGEIRRKQQAEAMFEAMHTGHSVYATMHADTAEQIKKRLTQPPIDIPETEIQALHLVVVQYRDRRRGIRRTLEIAEFMPGTEQTGVKLNYLYRWRARTDTFDKDNDSIRVVEDLNLHTGLTVKEIQDDLAEKEEVLQWMIDNNIKDVNKVGQIMRIYYKYPKQLMDNIRSGGKFGNVHDGENPQ
ncbi:MAG: ATPase, T2SS/T4P/T4SS family [Candidatus Woesearchaeota archaeon]